jgi:hypothetical protein
MEKWFCIWEFLANPKDNADLVPNCVAQERQAVKTLSHNFTNNTYKLHYSPSTTSYFLGRKLSLQ